MRRRLPTLAAIVATVSLATVSAVAAAPAAAASGPSLSVPSACLIYAHSGRRLYNRNGYQERAIASTTKIMTVLITLQHVKHLNRIFTQTNWVATPGESSIGLQPGERMSVRDLLYAALLPSANDAAVDLAYNVGHHSIPRFLRMMNAEARRLGLHHTHYTSPDGLDTPGNYSTACDLVKLSRYVLAHFPFFKRVVRMKAATLKTGSHVRHIVTTDFLMARVPWIHGVKTGFTADAGYVLVSQGKRDGMSLIGAILHAGSEASRDQNGLSLLDWGFAHYRLAHIVKRHQVLGHARAKGAKRRVPLIARSRYSRVVPRSARIRIVDHLRRRPLVGPMRRGAVVGFAAILVNGHRVGARTLLLGKAIPKPAAKTLSSQISLGGISLMVLALAAAAVGVGAARRHRRRPATGRQEER